jgi:N-acetyl-anhydromuramyl-L-alanine amidase AmpD
MESLSNIGYCVAANAEAPVVAAFQRRFRPARVDGVIDDETAFRLAEVQANYARSRKGTV